METTSLLPQAPANVPAQPEQAGASNVPAPGASDRGDKTDGVEKSKFTVLSNVGFEIDNNYELIKPIGHGAYGVVISAKNKTSGETVAIKKIQKAFENINDAKRILREIKLLKHFDHENIIAIIDVLEPKTRDFEDVYMVTDLMETDLHRIICSRQHLSKDHTQYFIYQILRALKCIHSANVIHRDLKPSNLLVNSNCDLKVCDFGLARGLELEDAEDQVLTEYVVTRWYRAPEIMLACQEYSKAIDVWSVGCIFGELLGRQPMFPGDHYMHQLELICAKLGKPTEPQLDFVTSEKAKRFVMKQPVREPTDLQTLYPKADADAIDLLQKMLDFHPSNRISVEEALKHPYLESLHNEEDEPSADNIFSFEFEKEEMTDETVRNLIWEEIKDMHLGEGEGYAVDPPPPVATKGKIDEGGV